VVFFLFYVIFQKESLQSYIQIFVKLYLKASKVKAWKMGSFYFLLSIGIISKKYVEDLKLTEKKWGLIKVSIVRIGYQIWYSNVQPHTNATTFVACNWKEEDFGPIVPHTNCWWFH